MDVLAGDGVEILDVEQVVLHGRLELGLLIEVPEGRSTVKELLFFGWQRGVHLDFEVVDGSPQRRGAESVVTVIGTAVEPAGFGAVARAIADGGGNIDRIAQIATYPVISYELAVSGGDTEAMRRGLGAASKEHQIDLAIQPEGLFRRAKRLVVMDVDSTLIQGEVIELLASQIGVGAEVARLTAEAMSGDHDFETSLRERVALLAGATEGDLERVRGQIQLTPGARTFVRTLHRLGMKVAVVSGGFSVFTDRLKTDLGLEHAVANRLEVVDGVVTGRLEGPVVDRAGKARVLREIAESEGIPLAQTVAVGDGANDIDMLSVAGLGIAFNAKPVVSEAADTSLSVPYLDAILFLLGIRRHDVETADLISP